MVWTRNRFMATFLTALLTAAGCRQTTFIADAISPDSATDTDTEETDSGIATDTADTATATDSAIDTETTCSLPDTFSWVSSPDMLIAPPPGLRSIKDPTIVYFNARWHVYATTAGDDGLNMTYLHFADWTSAGSATKTPVNTNPNLEGYKAAPQLFYFTPQQRWYLIYQTPDPAWSATEDPTDVASWSAMTRFMPMPAMITDEGFYGIDYWIICDDADCHMFFSALNGVLYRARTPRSAFPDGFEGTTEVVLQDENRYNLFDACNVYRMAGQDGDRRYLLLASALSGSGRLFRAFTAAALDGTWTPLADTPENPFAAHLNVDGADWATDGIGHGEIPRRNPDETMTVDPCDLQYLFSSTFHVEGDTDSPGYAMGLIQAAP